MQSPPATRQIHPRRTANTQFRRPPQFRLSRSLFAADKVDTFRPFVALMLVLVHMVLAIVMYRSAIIATLHALITMVWFARIAITGKRPELMAVAMAYVAGSEVLWRSTNAIVPQEIARYSICFFLIIAMMRHRHWQLPWPPLVYFGFLVPSILLTLTVPTLEMAKGQTITKLIVFNTIGPLTLMIAVCFFSRLRLNAVHLMNVCLGFVAPAMGLATMTLFAIGTTRKVKFGRSGVSIISEEFGPNQLSAAIGLGALFVFLMLVLDEEATMKRRAIMACGMVMMLGATAMTFSRGGIYNFAGAVVVALFFLLRDVKSRVRVAVVGVGLFFLGNYLVFPALNQMSGGALVQRFTSTSLTGRDKIAWADLIIWQENPVYGVGPGRAIDSRVMMSIHHQAHTEFTRMLAEHGFLGLISLAALIFMAVSSLLRRRGPRNQAVTASLIIWSFLYMTNAAMRLVAPSFVFGLACALLNCEFKTAPMQRMKRFASRRARVLAPHRAVTSLARETS